MNLTVIIPTYKPQTYLWECLDSLYFQTMAKESFEIIIVLNGCKEPYYEDIKAYIGSHTDMKVSLIQTDIAGVSNARNIGIDLAQGDYICFIDDDDVVSPSYLEDLLAVSSPICIGCSNSYAFVKSLEERKDNFLTNGYNKCINQEFSLFGYRSFLSPPYAKLIHRSLIGKSRFPVDLKKSEDSIFCLLISPNIKEMKLASPNAIYYQRLREGSAMRKKESVWSIFKEHLFIEGKYFSVWLKNPLRYNIPFFLSRVIACERNCFLYIMSKNTINGIIKLIAFSAIEMCR